MVCVPKVERRCSIPNKIGKKSRRNRVLSAHVQSRWLPSVRHRPVTNHSGSTVTRLRSFSKLIWNRVLCGVMVLLLSQFPLTRGSARGSCAVTVPRNCTVGKSHATSREARDVKKITQEATTFEPPRYTKPRHFHGVSMIPCKNQPQAEPRASWEPGCK